MNKSTTTRARSELRPPNKKTAPFYTPSAAEQHSPTTAAGAGQSSPRAAEPRPSALHITAAEKPAPRFRAAVTFCRAPCNDSAEQATKKPCGGRGLSMIRKNAQSQNQNKMCRNLHKICKSLQKYAILLHIRKLNQLFQSYLHLSRGFYVQSADFYFSYLQFKKNVIELKAEKGKSGDRCNSHRFRFLVRATYQVKRTP